MTSLDASQPIIDLKLEKDSIASFSHWINRLFIALIKVQLDELFEEKVASTVIKHLQTSKAFSHCLTKRHNNHFVHRVKTNVRTDISFGVLTNWKCFVEAVCRSVCLTDGKEKWHIVGRRTPIFSSFTHWLVGQGRALTSPKHNITMNLQRSLQRVCVAVSKLHEETLLFPALPREKNKKLLPKALIKQVRKRHVDGEMRLCRLFCTCRREKIFRVDTDGETSCELPTHSEKIGTWRWTQRKTFLSESCPCPVAAHFFGLSIVWREEETGAWWVCALVELFCNETKSFEWNCTRSWAVLWSDGVTNGCRGANWKRVFYDELFLDKGHCSEDTGLAADQLLQCTVFGSPLPTDTLQSTTAVLVATL